MTRNEAIERVSKPEMNEEFLMKEFEYVGDKLGLKKTDLQKIFEGENKSFKDYKSKIKLINFGGKMMQKLSLEKRLFR